MPETKIPHKKALITQAGCVLDGIYGDETNDRRLLELAKQAGMSPNITDPDKALEYLQEHATAPELALAWIDGDLLALPREEDED